MSQRIGDLLVAAGVLDHAGLQQALAARDRSKGSLGRCIVDLGLVSEETYVRALSAQLQLPAVSLDPAKLAASVVRTVSRETCERYGLVPFRVDAKLGLLDVAMSDASNNHAIDEVEAATRMKVRPFVAGPTAVERALRAHANGVANVVAVGTPPPPPPLPTATNARRSSPRPAPAALVDADPGAQRVADLEAAVRRLEGLVLSLVGLLVERGQVDPADLAKRMADAGSKKGDR